MKTGDSLDIGNGKQLIFVETPMLHWPDSMMTYMTGDAVLFSNDAFGQHYCDERLFNDEVDQTELFEQCQRYYANILTPFSRLVTPKITEISLQPAGRYDCHFPWRGMARQPDTNR